MTPTTTTPPSPAHFSPDYAVPPGDLIAEWLEEQGMSQAELATRTSLAAKTLNQIVRGHVPLSQETALKLEAVTGVPAMTWNGLQALYAEDRARIAQTASLSEQVAFLKELPVAALRKLGVLKAPARDKPATLREVLSFFGVADPEAWRSLWQSPQAAFRKSSAFTSGPGAVAAWLRMGELQAAGKQAQPFEKDALRSALLRLRPLTTEPDPAVFVPELERLCAEVGVVVVFVPEVKGSRCSGAARWLSGRPVVQISLRYRSDDHLWFTFFHELGHVLLHPRSEVFVDDGAAPSADQAAQEDEANAFARDLLIPPGQAVELPRLKSLTDMQDFAVRIGTSPGVVVGRLQKEGLISYKVGNGLKRRYAFSEAV